MGILPFLKWAGGKRWLVSTNGDLFNIDYNNYIEPFVGSGAVFFHLLPKKAILSDNNVHLINVYRAIKCDFSKIVSKLKLHSNNHSDSYYITMRDTVYSDIYSQAAQFIYLNRTCWNGLYRVNKQGKFNVPKGSRSNVLLNTDNFEAIANILNDVELIESDFEAIIDKACVGDLVFADPPYTVNHNNNGFLKYNQHIFSWEDQIRLSKCLIRARDRGAKVILTNANHESIRELYSDSFIIRQVPRASSLAGKSEYRGRVTELLVTG